MESEKEIMNESSMKQSLRRVVFFFGCMSLIFIGAAYLLIRLFITAFNDTTQEKMMEEVNNYKRRIERQIDRNFQMLNTVAGMIGKAELYRTDFFHTTLEEADLGNDFLLFGFFDREGNGFVSREKESYALSLDEAQEEIKEIIYNSYEGKESVSNAFWGKFSHEMVLMFSVPVYHDNQIVGALVASDDVDVFSDTIGEKQIFSGNGTVHLIDSEGNFILRADESVVKEEKKSILEEPYMSKDKVNEIRDALKSLKTIEFDFEYEKENYNVLLKPLKENGWYIMCINSVENVNKNIYRMIKVIEGFMAVIMILFFIRLFYVIEIIQKNNRQLKKYAYFDELTGLYNRRRFDELAEESLKKQKKCTIVALNIRQFKFINEMFGKKRADKLLKYIAHILSTSIEEGEYVCRESADAFYMFLKETNRSDLEERLKTMISKIIYAEGTDSSNYHMRMRCGIAVSISGEDFQSIMTQAMFALAESKENVQEDIWFFDSELYKQEQMNHYIERYSYKALENNEFKLFLQPKMNLEDDTLVGAEALTRLVQQNGKMIYPNAFIRLFETNGFCAELDMYMFEKVCHQLRMWMDAGYEPVPISINQSKITFYRENYQEELCSILNKYNIPAFLISLEILEGLAIDNIEELNKRLMKLKEIGFKISMDDFGTGYSSLNTLAKLAIDEVKLDRGFLIEAAGEDGQKTRLIMEGIVELSKKLSISTVIEGIETGDDVQFVKQIGCDQGQGYFYRCPVSAEIFTKEILLNKETSAYQTNP